MTGACAVHAADKRDKEARMLDQGLALLQKKDTQSVCEGARMLARLGPTEAPKAIDPLLALIRTRDETARECVRDALNKLDVAPVLLARWRGADQEARKQALESAVPLSHPGLLALYEEAVADADAFVRRRAATGLRHQQEGPALLAVLGRLLADADDDVRWWANDTASLSKSAEVRGRLEARLDEEPSADLKTFIARALGGR
jgi:hypothetical protein